MRKPIIDVKSVSLKVMREIMKREIERLDENDGVDFVVGFCKAPGCKKCEKYINLSIDKYQNISKFEEDEEDE